MIRNFLSRFRWCRSCNRPRFWCQDVYNAQTRKCEPMCYRCFMHDWNVLKAAYSGESEASYE